MATITTGHDTTNTTTPAPAPVKKVVKKQTPMWVILVSALAAPVVFGGGIKLITSLQDMGGSYSVSFPSITETRQEREVREHRQAWQDLSNSLDQLDFMN